MFNPAAWTDGKHVYLLYRAEGPCSFAGRPVTSCIGLATSNNGFSFGPGTIPVMEPTESYEVPGGCEDPRVVQIKGSFYMTYTAYDGYTARLALATSTNLYDWKKEGLLFPERGWTKSAAILSKPVNGYYWMYFGDTNIWAAYSTDLRSWTIIEEPVLSPREGYFDCHLVEPGPPPVVTPEGILLIYNAADQHLHYSVGQCLFAHDNPLLVMKRSERPFLEPETVEEKEGQVPNVIFAEGLVPFGQQWLLYYGMADSRIGVAILDTRSDPSYGMLDIVSTLTETP